jgi:uncharacterized damage-inducible protein DinB
MHEVTMIPAAAALLAELDAETPATRRVFDRLPADRLGWRPHPKSMSAAQLAQHVAQIPGNIARIVQLDRFDVATRPAEYAACESKDALLATFDASIASAKDCLSGLAADHASAIWRLTFGEREIFALPRLVAMRTIAFNHWYHHRGELVVYLRLLDVPVPIVYGRTADENPFAQSAA